MLAGIETAFERLHQVDHGRFSRLFHKRDLLAFLFLLDQTLDILAVSIVEFVRFEGGRQVTDQTFASSSSLVAYFAFGVSLLLARCNSSA